MIVFGITIILIICVVACFIMLGIFHRMPDMAISALVLAILFTTISGCIWVVAQEERDAIINPSLNTPTMNMFATTTISESKSIMTLMKTI